MITAQHDSEIVDPHDVHTINVRNDTELDAALAKLTLLTQTNRTRSEHAL